MIETNPEIGTILKCNFNGNIRPEFDGERFVVIVPNPRRKELTTIVPLQKTPPQFPDSSKYIIELSRNYGDSEKNYCYARCDMVCSVSFSRLTPIANVSKIDEADLYKIVGGIKCAFNL